MGINDLPKPGIGFRATAGAGNFQRKLSNATRYGDLKNLRDNQEAIVKAIGSPTVLRAIRRGGLSRLQQLGVWHKIKASDKTVTKEDKREIKQVLKYLGRSMAASASKMGVKAGNGNHDLSETQIKRNILRSRHQAVADLRGRQFYSTQYGGGKVQITSIGAAASEPEPGGRTKGTMGDLNIKRGSTGFAKQPSRDTPAGDLPPQAPGGVRPTGL